MRLRWEWWLVGALALLVACARSDTGTSEQAAAPQPVAVAKADVPDTAAGDDEDPDGDPYFDFDTEPMDPNEFEIDADATTYFGFSPIRIYFGAVALNGKPPFTFTWDFKDGTPIVEAERIEHVFTRTGRILVRATGTDADGNVARTDLGLVLLSHEEFAFRSNTDPDALPTHPIPELARLLKERVGLKIPGAEPTPPS